MMKLYRILTFVLLTSGLALQAQNPGDTIKVRTFHYGSNTRDTFALFPPANLSFEKIIMKYNMRCKNGLVSNSTDRNLGCGEWDYSCNTYIVDSSKIEEQQNFQQKYVFSKFNGSSFPYTTQAVYDYYRYKQQSVKVNSISNDSIFSVSQGTEDVILALKTNEKSGKSQFLYLNSELLASGLTAGAIRSMQVNVSNGGGKAGFLKVRIKHTNVDSTLQGLCDMNGFTELFNGEYIFNSGLNRIVFKTPFNWNGTQNLLVEFSFTNSQAQSQVVFSGIRTNFSSGLCAYSNHAVNLSNLGHIKLDTNRLSTIRNEFTISFRAYGDPAFLPMSNSILYGTDNNTNNRQLNIHLPHSSKNIFFDCGFASGGYDRISQLAPDSLHAGKWNNWVFTKNAVTGTMKIFLNGKLWLTGTGKTKPIQLMNLILGKDINLINNFKGKVNHLAFWNAAIPDSMIPILNQSTPDFLSQYLNKLVAYYPLGEGSGQNVQEIVGSVMVNGTNLEWNYDRGDQLTRDFVQTLNRPGIGFCKGNYNITVIDTFVLDSLRRSPNLIEQYSIVSKSGVTPFTNDQVKLDTSYTSYCSAAYSKIFNADIDSMPVIDSIPVVAEGTLVQTNLSWYRRYPWYNEIMSFVTPYGIGLNLGMEGKDWYFDVSDFAPILKDKKRIVMTLGGQNQEQNDIEFWFIVGTAPRTVLEFNQIWQGTNRTGAAALTAINNETRFPSVNVPLLAGGKDFKIRSSITGHGAEGEFEVNGGPVDHMFNLNGGNVEFTWKIVTPCSGNPVFPQGGTWVYDRQGWCPGQSSLLTENNISAYVTAGSTVNMDYLASTPPKAGGAYNYQVAHQLVTYGSPNFALDARIMEVTQPSNKILYGRNNPVCAQPKIVVQNSGAGSINKIEISYWINQSSNKQSYTWTGNLASMKSITISLPTQTLWENGIQSSNNQFHAEIKKVNDVVDDYVLNNHYISGFNIPEIVPSVFTLEFRTNNNPTENEYKIYDGDGNLVDSKSFVDANTTFSKAYNLGGCFRLVVEDFGQDGLQWWANSAQGTGFVRIKRANGSILKTFQPDFGKGFEYSFTTNWALSQEELSFGTLINLYPNPSKGQFTLEGKELENAEVKILDVMGKELELSCQNKNQERIYNTENLQAGIYFVVIRKNGEQVVKQVMIYE